MMCAGSVTDKLKDMSERPRSGRPHESPPAEPRPGRTVLTALFYLVGCVALVIGAASDVAGYPIDGWPAETLFVSGVGCVLIGWRRLANDERRRRKASSPPSPGIEGG